MKLYRVTIKTTQSLQHTETYWDREIVYCGYDRDDARRAYHESKPLDFYYGYGNRVRRTNHEVVEDAGTEDFADDSVAELDD